MTNEEKAKEILNGEAVETDYNRDAAYSAAIGMAQWKDEQFSAEKKAWIDKACDAYCKTCGNFPHTVPTRICRLDCQYYTDFRKLMEETK